MPSPDTNFEELRPALATIVEAKYPFLYVPSIVGQTALKLEYAVHGDGPLFSINPKNAQIREKVNVALGMAYARQRIFDKFLIGYYKGTDEKSQLVVPMSEEVHKYAVTQVAEHTQDNLKKEIDRSLLNDPQCAEKLASFMDKLERIFRVDDDFIVYGDFYNQS